MREIIHIHVGQCGVNIGNQFWDSITKEHTLDPETKQIKDLSKIPSSQLFYETPKNVYNPLALFTDLDPEPINCLRSGPLGKLFALQNLVYGTSGAGNNWSKGHYTEGAEMYDEFENAFVKMAEKCDSFQGYQIVHSLGAGTGSGLGTLILNKLRELYPEVMSSTVSIFPSPKVSNTVVEPYNAILGLHQIIENADLTFCFDNSALYDICSKTQATTYRMLNTNIVRAMSELTVPMRFDCDPKGLTHRKLAINLVPWPRMHFINCNLQPLCEGSVLPMPNDCADIFMKNSLADINLGKGAYLGATTIFRCKPIKWMDMENMVNKFPEEYPLNSIGYIPDSRKSVFCKELPIDEEYASACFGNTTAITHMIRRILDCFDIMFKRKAFLRGYCGEGIDEMEFNEASANAHDLIDEYQHYEGTNSCYDPVIAKPKVKISKLKKYEEKSKWEPVKIKRLIKESKTLKKKEEISKKSQEAGLNMIFYLYANGYFH